MLSLYTQVDGGGYTPLFGLSAVASNLPAGLFSPAFGDGAGAFAFFGCDTATTDRNGMAMVLLGGGAGGSNRNGGDSILRPGAKTGSGVPGKSLMQSVDATNVVAVGGTTGAETLGFFGATLVTQPADVGALTDNLSGTTDGTMQALTDPADAPASVDALRDDLVANLIPELRNNLAELTVKHNAWRSVFSAGASGLGLTA